MNIPCVCVWLLEQVQELEDLVYELSVNLDTVKDTQEYMKAIKQYHLQGARWPLHQLLRGCCRRY